MNLQTNIHVSIHVCAYILSAVANVLRHGAFGLNYVRILDTWYIYRHDKLCIKQRNALELDFLRDLFTQKSLYSQE